MKNLIKVITVASLTLATSAQAVCWDMGGGYVKCGTTDQYNSFVAQGKILKANPRLNALLRGKASELKNMKLDRNGNVIHQRAKPRRLTKAQKRAQAKRRAQRQAQARQQRKQQQAIEAINQIAGLAKMFR